MDRSERRGLTRKVWGYFRDPRVAKWRKWTGVLALAYLFSPVDAVPDLLPVLGWLDDLGVLSGAAMLLYRDIQKWRPPVDSLPHRVSEPRPGERQRSA